MTFPSEYQHHPQQHQVGAVPTTRVTRVKDLIRVVTLHAAVVASGSLTYLVGCGIASNYSDKVGYLEHRRASYGAYRGHR